MRVVGIGIALGFVGGLGLARLLAREQLLSCFSAIVAAEDTPLSKPSPDPYLRALAMLSAFAPGLRGAECIAIEDSRWGLESARAAGLHTVAVTHTYPAGELMADLTIASLAAIDLDQLDTLCRE
jgi:beta-phosphoglucomutase-like phosphatase (HAD superfamily)